MSKFLYDITEESSDSNDSVTLDTDAVTKTTLREPATFLIAIIGDEDTCVGFLLGGIGEVDDEGRPNYFIVDRKTKDMEIDSAFQKFVRRRDIGIILITKEAAGKIPNTIHAYNKKFPMVVQIPDKNGPFDLNMDQVLEKPKKYGNVSCLFV